MLEDQGFDLLKNRQKDANPKGNSMSIFVKHHLDSPSLYSLVDYPEPYEWKPKEGSTPIPCLIGTGFIHYLGWGEPENQESPSQKDMRDPLIETILKRMGFEPGGAGLEYWSRDGPQVASRLVPPREFQAQTLDAQCSHDCHYNYMLTGPSVILEATRRVSSVLEAYRGIRILLDGFRHPGLPLKE
jgi:hypothetical protein